MRGVLAQHTPPRAGVPYTSPPGLALDRHAAYIVAAYLAGAAR